MGYWAAGQCWDVQAEADTALWSAVPPVLVGSDPPGVLFVHLGTSGWEYRFNAGGASVSAYAVPSVGYAECTVGQSAIDGAELGFLVGGVWLAVWAVLLIGRTFRGTV
jgi:hypothetical protein